MSTQRGVNYKENESGGGGGAPLEARRNKAWELISETYLLCLTLLVFATMVR